MKKHYFQLQRSAYELIEMAREKTGIDIIDSEALEPLGVLIHSLNIDAGLHAEGAMQYEKWLLRVLCNRLRMKRDFLAHPEIAEEKISNPVFAYGSPRSGTTKLQKVLAASGDFNWMQFWQTFNPSLITGNRDESPRQRIEETEEFIRWIDDVTPDAKLGHPAETYEPEEETFWSDHCLRTPAFNRYVSLTGYLTWLGTQDMRIYFRELKDALKYFQWQGLASASKRWLLKSPIYPGLEAEIMDIFPDASLVMTHRSPYEIIGSAARLQTAMFPAFTHQPIDYRALVPGIGGLMDQHVKVRKSRPDINILDIKSIDDSKSIVDTVETIYRHINMVFSETSRNNIAQWERENPMHKKGAFKYTLDEFGIRKEDVDTHFSSYFSLLGELGFSR